MTILCPHCCKLAYWSSHFGAYICEKCQTRFNEDTGKEVTHDSRTTP
jgi:tRNA(Ile2) C34 agmatinyltransferase TiaS